MGGDEMIAFEESKFDELVEMFLDINRASWEAFVEEQFSDYQAERVDYEKDRRDING